MALDLNKSQKLRTGSPIEIEPGVYGQYNPKTGRLDLTTGESLPIPSEDLPFIAPKDESQKRMAQKSESLQREVEGTPFGETLFKLGEHFQGAQFFKQLGENFIQRPIEAMQTQPGQENLSYFERLGENKANEIAAYQNTSKKISETSPYATAAGAVAGTGLDLFATRNISPGRAMAGLHAAGNIDTLLEDPGEVLKGSAIAGGLGYGAGKTFEGLSKLAGLRGARRATKGAIESTEAANIADQEALNLANQQGKYQTELQRQSVMGSNAVEEAKTAGANLLGKDAVNQANINAKQAYASQKASNDQIINQWKVAKVEREKEIFNLQQDFAQRQAARDAEVFKTKQEYDIAKQNHSATEAEKKRIWQESVQHNKQETTRLKQQFEEKMQAFEKEKDLLPQLQQESNRQFSANTIQSMEHVANVAGRDATFSGEQLGVNQFVNEILATGEMAGSPVAREASNFLNGIFSKSATGRMSSAEVVKAFKAIEGRMAKGSPALKQVLGEFKDFFSQRLPQAVSDSRFYAKQFGQFEKKLLSDVDRAIKVLRIPEMSAGGVRNKLKDILKSLTPEEFTQLSRSGDLKRFITSELGGNKTRTVMVGGKAMTGTQFLASDFAKNISQYIDKEAEKIFGDLRTNSFVSHIDTKKALGGKIDKLKGFAEEIPAPIEPLAPEFPGTPPQPEMAPLPQRGQIPEPLPPPELPPPVEMPNIQEPISPIPQQFTPAQPNVQPVPGKFVEQPFTPQPVPQLQTPQGTMGKLAAGLEDLKLGNLLKSKSTTDNPVFKLAGLKYLLGKSALPVELGAGAVVGGMKALTSPTAAGAVTRQSFKQGMLGLINSMAQRYPSYRNGILDNPIDRRSLVKEIEENPQMSLEDKAIYQSRINRGEALFDPNNIQEQGQPQRQE